MITKITKLHGLGTLHAPLPNGALALKTKTIIYGENGRGKTTLVALLRSLASGETGSLKQRRTIRGINAQSAQVLVRNQPYDLSNDLWTRTHADICVFDASFISENVYSGPSIDTDQRKNLLSFAIGSTGVALAREVDRLAAAIATKRTDESNAKENIRKYISGTLTPEQFAYLTPAGDDANTELAAAKKRKDAVARSSMIQTLQTLAPISFEGFDWRTFVEKLRETFESVSLSAVNLLQSHIEATQVTQNWLEQGARFETGDVCPYCAQDTRGNALVEAYRVSFSQAYKSFKDELRAALGRFGNSVSAEKVSAIRMTVDGNRSRLLPWKEFLSDVELPFDSVDLSVIRSASEVVRAATDRKLANPLEPVVLTPAETALLSAVDTIMTAIDDYNARQVHVNDQIASLRSTVAAANLVAADAEVVSWENRIARKDEKADKATRELLDAIAERQRLEGEKAAARTTLDIHTATTVGRYKDAINKHLKGCGTSFQITELKTVYTGAKPRFDYAIELFGTPVDLMNKPGSPLVFDSAFSLGDKSALAFSFFLARLENDPRQSEQIVVFDDPLSSLDSCRRRYTRIQIAELAPSVAQLIVLTHEEATVADIAGRLKESECCVLALRPQGDFSIFVPTSVKEITASDYARYFDALTHYLHGAGKAEDVVKVVRPFLELNLRYRFPENFGPDASLGEMIGDMRTSDASKPLSKMNMLRATLEGINGFCVSHSHGDKALVNAEKILDSELKIVVSDALQFARGLPN